MVNLTAPLLRQFAHFTRIEMQVSQHFQLLARQTTSRNLRSPPYRDSGQNQRNRAEGGIVIDVATGTLKPMLQKLYSAKHLPQSIGERYH